MVFRRHQLSWISKTFRGCNDHHHCCAPLPNISKPFSIHLPAVCWCQYFLPARLLLRLWNRQLHVLNSVIPWSEHQSPVPVRCNHKQGEFGRTLFYQERKSYILHSPTHNRLSTIMRSMLTRP